MRFDQGAGYVYAQTLDNIIVLHGEARRRSRANNLPPPTPTALR